MLVCTPMYGPRRRSRRPGNISDCTQVVCELVPCNPIEYCLAFCHVVEAGTRTDNRTDGVFDEELRLDCIVNARFRVESGRSESKINYVNDRGRK